MVNYTCLECKYEVDFLHNYERHLTSLKHHRTKLGLKKDNDLINFLLENDKDRARLNDIIGQKKKDILEQKDKYKNKLLEQKEKYKANKARDEKINKINTNKLKDMNKKKLEDQDKKYKKDLEEQDEKIKNIEKDIHKFKIIASKFMKENTTYKKELEEQDKKLKSVIKAYNRLTSAAKNIQEKK